MNVRHFIYFQQLNPLHRKPNQRKHMLGLNINTCPGHVCFFVLFFLKGKVKVNFSCPTGHIA